MLPPLSLCAAALLAVFPAPASQTPSHARAAEPTTLDDSVSIEGAGTRLVLELHGRSDSGPVILYLHGGPGSALGLVLFRSYAGPRLEPEALVAYLHQRGVLGSPVVPDSTQTIANHIADVDSAIAYLTQRFPGRPLYLLGHSWGGLLATLVAAAHPQHLNGIVLVAAPFDQKVSLKESYTETLAWARRTKNDDAVQSLTAAGPPPYSSPEQLLVLARLSSAANGGIAALLNPAIAFGRAPYTSPPGSAWTAAETGIARVMLPQLNATSTTDQVARIKLPLLLLVGARDTVVPATALQDGYQRWGGPKQMVVLSDSHHLAFVDEPERFAAAVLTFVSSKP